MEDNEEQEEHITGPGVGGVDEAKLAELMAEFRKLSPLKQAELIQKAAHEDMYAKIIMGQASHQDIANALRAVDKAGIIAPPPSPEQTRLIEKQGDIALPPALPDYHEEESLEDE